MEIQVKGLVQVQKTIGIDMPKQILFATVQAVNDTAKEVQKHEVEKQLPSKLTLRSKGSPWWKPGTRFGVNIRFANKSNPVATVGSQADWLKLQEQGGTKTASGHRLAIEAGARPSKTAVLTQAIKPRRLLETVGSTRVSRRGKTSVVTKKGKGFIIKTKSGDAIFIRSNGALKLMYMLEQSASIPAILEFFEGGKAKVLEIYQTVFDKRLKQAVATAKSK